MVRNRETILGTRCLIGILDEKQNKTINSIFYVLSQKLTGEHLDSHWIDVVIGGVAKVERTRADRWFWFGVVSVGWIESPE